MRQAAALPLIGLAVLAVIGAALATPAAAQDPIGGALATLAAATAQAEQVKASQRATAAAASAESARLANIAQATARAQSAQATQAALDDLNRQRALTATAQAQSVRATQGAIDATVTAGVISGQATLQAQQIEATRQAVLIAAQATDAARLSETYAERQERFSFGLLVVEIAAIIGACFVLWRIARTLTAWADRMRPQTGPTLAGLIDKPGNTRPVIIDAETEPARAERMPATVQVYDDARMIEAIDRWAERYDAAQGGGDVN